MRSFRQGRRKSLEENAGHRATELPQGTHANQLHRIRAQRLGAQHDGVRSHGDANRTD
jgi:hypothetical protein